MLGCGVDGLEERDVALGSGNATERLLFTCALQKLDGLGSRDQARKSSVCGAGI